ncbi:MAG: DUF2059 domain-containing protein [Paracoccaceae bacterium]
MGLRSSGARSVTGAMLLALALAGQGIAQTTAQEGAVTATPAPAEVLPALTDAEMAAFSGALRLPELMDVMRAEGLKSGAGIAESMFPEEGGDGWRRALEEIYAPDRLANDVNSALARELNATDAAAIIAYFETEPGRAILEQELAARKAMLEPEVEEASHRRLDELRLEEATRLGLIGDYITANDLITLNVTSAMNSSLAFSMGLYRSGKLPYDMSDSEIAAEAWAQEPALREETVDWLYAYLVMAYEPIPEADLRDYIAFSESPAGQALNRAMFEAFGAVYKDISTELGARAANYMAGEEI